MDIKQLTELLSLLGNMGGGSSSSVSASSVGDYVIVRDRNEGINAGIVEMADETGVVLSSARRLWHHKPKDTGQSWYEGVANTGLSSDSRVSASVERKVIVGDYSMTKCTAEGRQSIEAAVAHAQS